MNKVHAKLVELREFAKENSLAVIAAIATDEQVRVLSHGKLNQLMALIGSQIEDLYMDMSDSDKRACVKYLRVIASRFEELEAGNDE